jgi:hypothetical protein
MIPDRDDRVSPVDKKAIDPKFRTVFPARKSHSLIRYSPALSEVWIKNQHPYHLEERRNHMEKRIWIEPELIVLVRSKPEEAVLITCKMIDSSPGPTASAVGCEDGHRGPGVCSSCELNGDS